MWHTKRAVAEASLIRSAGSPSAFPRATIQRAERLLHAAQKRSCVPLCVPLLSIHHLTARTCLCLMMSSLCGPLFTPIPLIGPLWPPLLDGSRWLYSLFSVLKHSCSAGWGLASGGKIKNGGHFIAQEFLGFFNELQKWMGSKCRGSCKGGVLGQWYFFQ